MRKEALSMRRAKILVKVPVMRPKSTALAQDLSIIITSENDPISHSSTILTAVE